ncbi:MAG: T9SS type A sorting domain-containing protein [Saprospirales bacterium]|jgi:predicted alpha/beta superfamily hydrolase|nr:T9SS type A sorting domain-containing protein [Saprospirales bacterium]
MFNTYPLRALCWVLAFLPGLLPAQLTIKVTALPANTPASAKIYITGAFNNWNPADANMIMATLPDGQCAITLNPPVGPVRFKFTRGSWDTVEGNASGAYQPDHVVNYSGLPQTAELSILTWEDLAKTGATTGVTILDNSFYLPQLSRTRRIWIYLPPDYQATTKKYPVLYMHDGQNLFDPMTSFAGEWGIDESLTELSRQGDHGCIVVGIDNGGVYRFDEYSPWANQLYGGGQGDEYISFIVKTLKPYIDEHFRTLPDRQHTGIMGSSMGGLVSMYAVMEYQHIFSKAGIFSPAFWFAGDNPANQVLATGKRNPLKVYFLAGGKEPAYVAQDMQEVADAMFEVGFETPEVSIHVPADGQHAEWFWKREFPEAYKWLFAGAVTPTGEAVSDDTPAVGVYPNPASEWIRIDGLETEDPIRVQLIGADGSLRRDVQARPGASISTAGLPAGFYAVRVRAEGQNWQVAKVMLH